MVITCDGAYPNKNFFKISKQKGEITYKIRYPYSPEGSDVYFMSDKPNLFSSRLLTIASPILLAVHSHAKALWVSE